MNVCSIVHPNESPFIKLVCPQAGAMPLFTPLGQIIVLGGIFLLVFSSYITIQAFASKLYGESLASSMESTLYAVFRCVGQDQPHKFSSLFDLPVAASSVGSFFAPSATNKLGTRLTLFLGILGYAALVAASLVYFLKGDEWPFAGNLVILGGFATGLGASFVWTAQVRKRVLVAPFRLERWLMGMRCGTRVGFFCNIPRWTAVGAEAASSRFSGGETSLPCSKPWLEAGCT
jgi:hypothetical protein